MQEKIFKKGNTIYWVGLLGQVVFYSLGVLANPDGIRSLMPYTSFLKDKTVESAPPIPPQPM